MGLGTRARQHLVSGLVAVTAALAAVARRRKVWQGLAVVGLGFYGAWLIYRPAGFIAAAVLLLLDLVTDREPDLKGHR